MTATAPISERVEANNFGKCTIARFYRRYASFHIHVLLIEIEFSSHDADEMHVEDICHNRVESMKEIKLYYTTQLNNCCTNSCYTI